MRIFNKLLEQQWAQEKYLCVGLDPKLEDAKRYFQDYPVTEMLFFLTRAIVNSTKDIACAYKPNFAFYIGHGSCGLRALSLTIDHIRFVTPQVPIILDAKIGDIGATNEGYVRMLDALHADAITVHPYLGKESLQPLLRRKDKGIFVLCRTSNEGAGEFQDIVEHSSCLTQFQRVANNVSETWNEHGNCGLVAGATYPEELGTIRSITSILPLLIPGVGTQGGNLKESVLNAKHRFLINVSSGLLKNGLEGVLDIARQYSDDINAYRLQIA